MTVDIGDFIVDLVRRRNGDLATRLAYQAEALLETTCTDPNFGRLVDEYDVAYLLSSLAASDREFAETFPTHSRLSATEREEMMDAFERHFEVCEHCSLKRGYDVEMDCQIEHACLENKDALLELLLDNEQKGDGIAEQSEVCVG